MTRKLKWADVDPIPIGGGLEVRKRGLLGKILGKPIILDRLNETLEDQVRSLFHHVGKDAVERARQLPNPPAHGVLEIIELYDEIRLCIIFGQYGAAITLCGILVEFALKYATYLVERSGRTEDESLLDELEKMDFGRAIKRAEQNGLLNDALKQELVMFKDLFRNPYAHYNLRKITQKETVKFKRERKGDDGKLVVEEGELPGSDPKVIHRVKKNLDQANYLKVFRFADSVAETFGLISRKRQ